MSQPAPAAPRSALAPLRLPVFRWLWIAAVVSNIGSWMQTVGAQWFLVDNQSSPTVIALVQTAAAAPVLLFGLGAGVISELFNRRRLLIGVQAFQVCVGVGLALLTASGAMTSALLLVATFLIGSANALQLPAYMALVPEIVPRPLIPDAATLSSIGVNIARAVGPAVAGIAIARLGVPFVFAVNAATFAVFLVVLVAWRDYRPPRQRAEPFLDAARAGLRYMRYAGVIRRLYVQLALFMIPANALWALLPVIASKQLGVDANGYGLLLFAVGTGAIAGAFVTGAARRRLGTSTLVMASSMVYGAARWSSRLRTR
ncbi:MAG: MFS transporter [Terracoccus sp.]